MTRNLRGIYMGFEHDRPEDWGFLARWQPSVVRYMPHGSHTDPASVSVNRIERIHQTTPDSLILLRLWELDDRNYEAHAAMYADPIAEARKQHAYWLSLFGRIAVPRDRLMAGANNEPVPRNGGQAQAVYAYNEELARLGTRDGIRYGVYAWSVGVPPKPGEAEHDYNFYARLEPKLLDGGHAVIIHEYMQPEGMYGVWTDNEGRERHDWTNLMGRHLHSGLTRVPIIIGEWGIEGLIFNRNRHPDPTFGGHNGWRSFAPLWGPERYADEYVEYIRQCAPNVLAVCPFASDLPDRKWHSFDLQPAYGAFLARKHLCEREPTQTHTIHIPAVIAPQPQPPVVQDDFRRALTFVLRWEGGWADDPNDPGGATMQGITLGTFTRWRQAQGMGVPSKDDLRNIQPDERDAIYYQWYWLASKAHELAWPLCLAQFDTAVNGGVGRAQEMLAKSGGDFLRYMGVLIDWYTRINGWEHFGRGWMRRRAALLAEAAN